MTLYIGKKCFVIPQGLGINGCDLYGLPMLCEIQKLKDEDCCIVAVLEDKKEYIVNKKYIYSTYGSAESGMGLQSIIDAFKATQEHLCIPLKDLKQGLKCYTINMGRINNGPSKVVECVIKKIKSDGFLLIEVKDERDFIVNYKYLYSSKNVADLGVQIYVELDKLSALLEEIKSLG